MIRLLMFTCLCANFCQLHAQNWYRDERFEEEVYEQDVKEEAEKPNETGCRSCHWSHAEQERWNHNRFAEHQFEESSWPSRREELSDDMSFH